MISLELVSFLILIDKLAVACNKMGKDWKSFPKGGKIEKNGVWFFQAFTIPKLVEKCMECKYVVCSYM